MDARNSATDWNCNIHLAVRALVPARRSNRRNKFALDMLDFNFDSGLYVGLIGILINNQIRCNQFHLDE